MTNGEVLKANEIVLSKVPEDIRTLVAEMRALATKETWSVLTKVWTPNHRNIAQTLRSRSQDYRNAAAGRMHAEAQLELNDLDHQEHASARLIVALAYLSDKDLDLAISSFEETKH